MTELFIGLKNKAHIITEKQEDSQMAKKEPHIPAINDTPEALEAKIAAIKEAQKLGFKRCILPQANVDQIKVQTDMRLVGVSNVMEALDLI